MSSAQLGATEGLISASGIIMAGSTESNPADRIMALQNLHEKIYLTEEEYLKSELTCEFKREYIDGQVYAMADAGYNHNCISVNLIRKFANHLEGKSCTLFMTDMNDFRQEKQKND
jgi:Uma2 family endonuclease